MVAMTSCVACIVMVGVAVRKAIGFALMSVDGPRTLAAVLKVLFGFYQEDLHQVQAEAQTASTSKRLNLNPCQLQ
jgi:hypothetical protein